MNKRFPQKKMLLLCLYSAWSVANDIPKTTVENAPTVRKEYKDKGVHNFVVDGDGYQNIKIPDGSYELKTTTIREHLLSKQNNLSKELTPKYIDYFKNNVKVDSKNKPILIKDAITGEEKEVQVVDTESMTENKKDLSDLAIHYPIQTGRLGYIDHTIASVSDGTTLNIKSTNLDVKSKSDNNFHRGTNLYKAKNNSTINFDSEIIENPLAYKAIKTTGEYTPISAAATNYVESIEYIDKNKNKQLKEIKTLEGAKRFNDFLITELKKGNISDGDYQNYYAKITEEHSGLFAKVDEFKNSILSKIDESFLLTAVDNSTINILKDASIEINQGNMVGVLLYKGSKGTNHGYIYSNINHDAIRVATQSSFLNAEDGTINLEVEKDPTVTSSSTAGNNIDVSDGSTFENKGVINTNVVTNSQKIRLSSSNFINTGILNIGATPEKNLSYATGIESDYSNISNGKSGIITFGKTATDKKNVENSADVDIVGISRQVEVCTNTALCLNDSEFVNEGKMILGGKTQSVSLVSLKNAVFDRNNHTTDNTIINKGDVLLDGGNNIGFYISGNKADNNYSFSNEGKVDVVGEGITAIKLAGDSKIKGTNSGEINVGGRDKFDSNDGLDQNKQRNYAVWVENANNTFTNNGTINLKNTGSIGVHARGGASVFIDNSAKNNFIQGDSVNNKNQIGYFSYGKGSNITITSEDAYGDVASKGSTYARIENGSNLKLVNDASSTKQKLDLDLSGDSSTGFMVQGADSNLSGKENISLNIKGNNATGFIVSNGATLDLNKTTTAISGDHATFAVADGREFKINGDISEGASKNKDDKKSTITSSTIITDQNAKGSNVIGYKANKGGLIKHNGQINLKKAASATGVMIDGGEVINTGDISVNGIALHINGEGSIYSGAGNLTASNGKAAIFIDNNAFLSLNTNNKGKVNAEGTASAIIVNDNAKGVSISKSNINAFGSGNVIVNNKDNLNVTIDESSLNEQSSLNEKGKPGDVFVNNAKAAVFNLVNKTKAFARQKNTALLNVKSGDVVLNVDKNSSIDGSISTQKGSSSVNLNDNSTWDVLHTNSNVTNLTNKNKATLNLTNKNDGLFNVLTVDKNYTGGQDHARSGKLLVNTYWSNETSKSDLLDIKGNASGYTEVQTPKGIVGDVTRGQTEKYSADVVRVGDAKSSTVNAFYGFADTKGAGQAILKQKNDSTYAWYLPAQSKPEKPVTPVEPEKPVTPVEPEKPVTPVEPEKPVTPVEPEKPVTPVEPEKPVTPVEPEKPVTPVEPEKPVTPVEPEKPVTPVEPEKPVTPVKPEKPVTPVKPEKPVTQVEPEKPVTPVEPVKPVTPIDPVKPEVPGVVHMPTANMEMGYNLIRTLHERKGEQQTMAWDDCTHCQVTHKTGQQLWGKMLGSLNTVNGDNRYNYRSKWWGVQFGYDFNTHYDESTGSRRHSGIMATYSHDSLTFNDRRSVFFDTSHGKYSEQNSRTGTGKSDTIAVGGYTTFYDKNGSYLDLVGNLDDTHNHYKSNRSSESRNDSYGVTLSGEVGRPYALTQNGINNGDWEVEPQAQLIYQYRTFSNFKTEHDVSIDQKDRHGLRGRVGVRLAYNTGTPELKTNTVYFVGNVLHDFLDNNQTVKIGSDSIKEKTPATFGEIGAGVQLPVNNSAYFYIDARYSHSLSEHAGKADGARGNLGFKYNF